jgi:hypothetical protein
MKERKKPLGLGFAFRRENNNAVRGGDKRQTNEKLI